MREVIPLRERPIDAVLLVFFAINLFFVTYIVDLEQLVIADRAHFDYPLWPPAAMVDLVHWWGDNFDALQNARPAFWRATIWIDVILFGPYYAVAMAAFVKGWDWIRVPSIFWAGLMFANVSIIMFEETVGQWASPAWTTVFFANLPWWALPVVVLARFAKSEHPFTREKKA
jgi:hypothetical protein